MQGPTILSTTPLDGTSFTASLNEALTALSSCILGPVDPATQPALYNVQPGSLWWDTTPTPDELKVRNATNDDWVTLLKFDGGPSPTVLALLNAKLSLSGGTLSNFLTLHADPTADLHAASKQYVDETSRPSPLRFLVHGNAAVANKLAQVLITQPCRMTAINVYADTAPAGAALTVTLTRKRTSVADDSRSASMDAGINSLVMPLGTPMVLQAQDRLRFDVTSVGSSTPGGNDLIVTATLAPP